MPDGQEIGGSTDLHDAAGEGDVERLVALIVSGACTSARNREGRTPLHLAAADGHLAVVEALCDARDALVDESDARGRTALYYAAGSCRLDVVEALLHRGASAKMCDELGSTPLHAAAANCSASSADDCMGVLSALCDSGADAWACERAPNGQKRRPLDHASKRADHPAACFLLRAMAENAGELLVPNVDDEDSGLTCMHLAAWLDDSSIIWMRLDVGESVDVRDCNGDTPLHFAARYGSMDAIYTLVGEADAKIGARNSAGHTPFHAAVQGGQPEAVCLLGSFGPDPSSVDSFGNTPLHLAVEYPSAEMTRATRGMGLRFGGGELRGAHRVGS